MKANKTFSSRPAFILAAIAAAIGLGNIWRFPYIAGANGGGAFVLVYLVCVFFVAIPILIAELYLGKLGRNSPPLAMERVAEQAGYSKYWSLLGWMGLIVAYLIATYYSVISGWILKYIFKAASNFDNALPSEIPAQFAELLANPMELIFWHTIFMGLSVFIVNRGLRRGIERTVKILMPCFFVMMLMLIAYALVVGDAAAALRFLFQPDFTKINGQVLLAAIGQAFFSIGVAMGLMMTYGSYMTEETPIIRSAFIISLSDTLIAILAGLMIFPLVFGNQLDPTEGAGLIFVVLPTAFASMPGGFLSGPIFFLLLVFVAITSMIAILEPIVAYAEDRWNMKREAGSFLFGFIAWSLGLMTVFSFNLWSDVKPLDAFQLFTGKTIFDLIDYFTANVMMPLGAIIISLFVGWKMQVEKLKSDLGFVSEFFFRMWLLLVRFLAPIAIFAIFISNFI
jgi:NSS family neurotransmitter:Na+ symporter|tara:strand:+ start:1921 stop:3279 length:1359 start_codon:yes stop_codon:yes gene_type:complete